MWLVMFPEYKMSVVSVEGRPASLAWPIAAGNNSPCAPLHCLTNLTHIDTPDTRLRAVILSQRSRGATSRVTSPGQPLQGARADKLPLSPYIFFHRRHESVSVALIQPPREALCTTGGGQKRETFRAKEDTTLLLNKWCILFLCCDESKFYTGWNWKFYYKQHKEKVLINNLPSLNILIDRRFYHISLWFFF